MAKQSNGVVLGVLQQGRGEGNVVSEGYGVVEGERRTRQLKEVSPGVNIGEV